MRAVIGSGAALDKFAELVRVQGGDAQLVYHPEKLPDAQYVLDVPAPCDGYLTHLTANEIGRICMRLGGGRETKNSMIDPAVGLYLQKKVGDPVCKGESLAQIHANDLEKGKAAVDAFLRCCSFAVDEPAVKPFVRGIIR